MNAVWSLLKSNKRPVPEMSPHYPESLSTITLPNGHHWPFGMGVGQTLFVRSSQQNIPPQIMAEYNKFTSLASSKSTSWYLSRMAHGYIIKGTPGIGRFEARSADCSRLLLLSLLIVFSSYVLSFIPQGKLRF